VVFFSGDTARRLCRTTRSVVLQAREASGDRRNPYGPPASLLHIAVTGSSESRANVAPLQDPGQAESAFHLAAAHVRQDRGESLFFPRVRTGVRHFEHATSAWCSSRARGGVSLDGLYMPRATSTTTTQSSCARRHPRAQPPALQGRLWTNTDTACSTEHVVVDRTRSAPTPARRTRTCSSLTTPKSTPAAPRNPHRRRQCAHGAAVGRSDEDALFYLRSRGVPAQMARGILSTLSHARWWI